MKYLVATLLLLSLTLAGCGHLTEDGTGLIFKTADPRLNIGIRLQQPAPPLPAVEPQVEPECRIKVNWNGTEFIYHLPGQASYERTIVEPSKGEAFVCTEQEAVDMGARKALR